MFNPGDPHPVRVSTENIFGTVSLIFWSATIIVTVTYVWLVMRADDLPPKRRFPATVASMSDDDEWTPGDVTGMIANPFYAINIDEGLAVPHEPLISEDDWIKANIRLIEELGAEPYLRNLLSVLKGNYPRGS